MNTHIAIWIGAISTLAVLSYLAGDNPVYRLFQQAALGISVGMGVIISWQQVLSPMWWKPIQAAVSGTGELQGAWWLLALIPGSLWYFQLSKKYFWVSTLISGLFVGVAAGQAFKGQILIILPQIGASMKPLNPFAADGGFTWLVFFECLSNLVLLVGTFTTLLYFFFSVKTDSPWLATPIRVGRITIMVALGAMFGSTVMTRMSYLLERIEYLTTWWHLHMVPAVTDPANYFSNFFQ